MEDEKLGNRLVQRSRPRCILGQTWTPVVSLPAPEPGSSQHGTWTGLLHLLPMDTVYKFLTPSMLFLRKDAKDFSMSAALFSHPEANRMSCLLMVVTKEMVRKVFDTFSSASSLFFISWCHWRHTRPPLKWFIMQKQSSTEERAELWAGFVSVGERVT